MREMMRKIETRVLAAVLAGAVGAFAVTLAFGHPAEQQPAVTPVAVVEVPVQQGVLRGVAETVVLRESVEDRTAQARRA
ncbi:hypothetical protein [Amycolatopsis benzoatilytica]|uniref:hypothetical protein n=1 Tax=Amycolatopsis benzoatilytica TaxID=346045 RepID=UPI00037AA3C8|nr:hypothetical protein [Amycolatopsis benzoatilytica]